MEVQTIQKLLFDFQQFERGLHENQVKGELDSYNVLLSSYQPLYETYTSQKAYSAPEFNIFDIIGFSRLEALLHTPFLTHLLIEKESHAQGSLFFDKLIGRLFPNLDKKELSKVYVKRELHTGGLGIIDMYIQFYVGSKPYYIVIENKIDAGDQERQLQRYHDFVEKKKGFSYDAFRLVYLTKYGTSPLIGFTIEQNLYDELTKSGVLVLWSYQTEILDWLSSCLPQVKSPTIQIIIEQYLKTIKNI